MKPMFNPPHVGEYIKEVYMDYHGWDSAACAQKIGIAQSTMHRILNGKRRITPSMAQRLSQTLGRSPESWVRMQANYDRWLERIASGEVTLPEAL